MQPSARDSYLETEVMTAPPQKLQFMLIDAAIRSIRRARQFWQSEEDERASETLIRAQQIVTELLTGLNRDVDAELAKKVASIYLFVFRSLSEANLKRDEKKLDDALKILEVERETWRLMCEKLGSTEESENAAVASPSQQQSGPQTPPLPDLSTDSDLPGSDTSTGFSLEA